jgi:putative nucleotidyltransferase with HDIG domain
MDRKYIEELLPEIAKIRDEELRNGVVKAWLLAAGKGNWKKIEDVPFTLLTETKQTLIHHTRIVTKMAISIAEVRDDLDLDILIAGALVHDVGKLLEYVREGGKIKKSALGKLVRHPVSGYSIVLQVGMPVEIAHIVAAHSKEGEFVQRSKEAIVINHCDFIDFDIARSV